MTRKARWGAVGVLVFAGLLAATVAVAQARTGVRQVAAANPSCQLKSARGDIKHVIYIQFDNTHLFRDRPQFASDLEQMPNLLNFMRDNGTLIDNDHTILISHTAGGILSSLTGLYPDRNGITVSNSYRYYKPDKTTASSAAFKYWTDLVDADNVPPLDPLPNMVNGDSGTPKNTPAPWVPYTRAGCDFGAVATANVVLENTSTGPNGDITKVFGTGTPEAGEAAASNAEAAKPAATRNQKLANLAQTDFVGIAVHCAVTGGICSGNANARPDILPDEPPSGYAAQGLFGAKYVDPAINHGQAAVSDLNGNPITDPTGNPGFPGFDGMSAAVSLGYVAQMQESGIPVTFAYISDAHDAHPSGPAYGPGESGYVAALQAYNKAFGDFFRRLAADGIDKSNTLFVFTVDENDHFAGGDSADGTWTHDFCNVSAGQTCPANQIGEVNLNINGVLPPNASRPSFLVHSDSAPTYYVTGQPAHTDPNVRQLERDVAAAKAVDPYVSSQPTPVTLWMADPVEEHTLHMVNADPNRTPTFTQFANPDYFIGTFPVACTSTRPTPPSLLVTDCIDYHFAWSHGDATDDIGRTWLGFVGPGVKSLGQTSDIWSDHTDVQPTMLSLLGLSDDYTPDGRVLVQPLFDWAVPQTLRAHRETLIRLADVYKQVTAPFGQFAKSTLHASTLALASGSASDDSTYTSIEHQIETLTGERDTLVAAIRSALDGAAFGGNALNEQQAKTWISQAESLLARAAALPGA